MQSTLYELKFLKSIPKNGLAIFCGLVTDDKNSKGRTKKKISESFEPLHAISHFMYLCDNKFHPEDLMRMMKASKARYGYLIINGTG